VRIEMVLPALWTAGMEVMVASLSRKLAGRGHEVGITCIIEKGELAGAVEAAGIRVTESGATGVANTVWLPRLTSHLRAIAPDVVHAHSGAWFKSALAARRAGVPRLVYTAHGFVSREPPIETVLNRIAVQFTDTVVSVSDNLAGVMKDRGLAGRRHAVIANGIDLYAFAPSATGRDLRDRLGISPGTLLVGTVARLEPIKNQSMLIQGIAQARGGGVDCDVVLIGEGSLRAELEAEALRLGIAEHVHFWGLEANVAPLYGELDIFTLTSDAEGTSISLLEAMASSICPVATHVGGNPVAVGDAGILVGARRPDELATAIRSLADDPERRKALGRAARERVERLYSDEAMLDRYEEVYAA
jgi:glycosyltransferase involved in cell wall biosynthesis